MIQVNQVSITEQDILREMQYHPANSQQDAMVKATEALIIGELVRQRAGQLGLALTENTDANTEEQLIEQLLLRELKLPEATDRECRNYYRSNPARFRGSPKIQLQHILFPAAPDDDLQRIAARTQAEQVAIELQAGADFAKLALRHSACPSKSVGGDLGVIRRGDTVPEFEQQLLHLPLGLHGLPLETRYGYHLVCINHIDQGNCLPYETVKQAIAEYLHTRVKHKAIAHYIQQLICEARIEGFDFGVSQSPLVQ